MRAIVVVKKKMLLLLFVQQPFLKHRKTVLFHPHKVVTNKKLYIPRYNCSTPLVELGCCHKGTNMAKNIAVMMTSILLSASAVPMFPNLVKPDVATASSSSSVVGRKRARELLKERTKNVKVYMVTNQAGQPFLAEGVEPNTQVGLFFFTAADASMMLMQMSQGAGGNARVEAVSLDKAFDMVSAKPTPSGLKDSKGRDLKVVFRFVPEVSQVQFYRQLTKSKPLRSVPVFVAPDLTLEKDSENLIPAFLDKDDLEKSWKELKQTHPELPLRPKIEAVDLLDLLEEMEKGNNSEIYQIGFYAPRKNLEWLQGNNEDES